MTRPERRARMTGRTARVTFTGPNRVVSTCARKSCGLIYSDLIGELSTRSDEFRVRWAAHNVRIHATGVKLIHHPVVGDLELAFESFRWLLIPVRASSPKPPNLDRPPRTP